MTTSLTGQLPDSALLDDSTLAPLPMRAAWCLWSGCLDAPDYIPAGSNASRVLWLEGFPEVFTGPRFLVRGAQ